MKILYFHQHFTTPKGSTGTRSYELARHLVSNGHEVTIIFLIGCDLHKNKAVSESDFERLLTAVGRLGGISTASSTPL